MKRLLDFAGSFFGRLGGTGYWRGVAPADARMIQQNCAASSQGTVRLELAVWEQLL